ncbi:MAG: hypothetical protein M0Q16_05365 [Candidatus Cloacimonetes bacterium]|nr:hypothetical protein [Candidatus Cloacimonadota bacterium]MCK9184782.1 hypothetical protein [Candidatus Cloacimonadota bacterium]MCK9584538.1 hypothetical protein [Candidatus Cloacimonadota bacterium]
MTFIASIKARNGVAIVADSLVTTSVPVLTFDDFHRFIEKNQAKSEFSVKDVIGLFKSQAHHTNDYEEKLIKYDKFTAITIAGSARIKNHTISDIISFKAEQNKSNSDYNNMTLKNKVDDFEEYIKSVLSEKDQKPNIDTLFIFTHFDVKTKTTEIIELSVNAITVKDKYSIHAVSKPYPKGMKVVCNGQNNLTTTLLYGCALKANGLLRMFVEKFIDVSKARISQNRIEDTLTQLEKNIYTEFPSLINELNGFKIRDLSLQEAVDLAYLLLKVEMDFQRYTQDIPTIGGVIKVATIDHRGYIDICGNSIISPT